MKNVPHLLHLLQIASFLIFLKERAYLEFLLKNNNLYGFSLSGMKYVSIIVTTERRSRNNESVSRNMGKALYDNHLRREGRVRDGKRNHERV